MTTHRPFHNARPVVPLRVNVFSLAFKFSPGPAPSVRRPARNSRPGAAAARAIRVLRPWWGARKFCSFGTSESSHPSPRDSDAPQALAGCEAPAVCSSLEEPDTDL